MRAASAVLGLTVAAIALVAPTGASGTFPGRNGAIAYAEFNVVYRVNPREGRVQVLRRSRSQDHYSAPAYSGDGRTIVFGRSNCICGGAHLFLMSADGRHVRRLRGAGPRVGCPALSLEGREVAFESDRDSTGAEQIYLIRTDGSHLQRLTSGNQPALCPRFSPDGRQIAFTRSDNINVMNVDGSGKRELTHNRPNQASAADASFSPDGQEIVFDRGYQIFFMRRDGTHRRRLTHDAKKDRYPVFSPNGQQIAFVQFGVGSNDVQANAGIWIMDTRGGHLRRLTTGAAVGLDWQPLARRG